MSEMEFRVGKAIEVCKEQPSFVEKVEELSRQTGLDVVDLTEDWGDEYQSMAYRGEYVYVKGRMFKLLDDANIEDDYDVKEVTMQNGEFHYKLRYYNGGTNFEEMFESALTECEERETPQVYSSEDIVEILDDIINYVGGTDSEIESYICEIRRGYEK